MSSRCRLSQLLATMLMIATLPAFVRAEGGETGFAPLFNGKDLEGWVNVNCAPQTWAVKDGLITCTGKPTGALRTTKQYENFIFECEWRHLTSGGNAGIFVWSSPIAAPGVPFLRAIEVQVLDHGYGNTENYTTHGDVFPIHGSTMEPFGRHRGMRSFPSENRSRPSPEWNHYRVVAQDGVIRLSVNGKEVSGGAKCNWRKGYLGLESEGAPTEWKNLRIKELPTGNATADDSAPESEGFRSLYTGTDLKGWKSDAIDAWTSKDWELVCSASPDPRPMWTTAEFGDFEAIVDCKLPLKTAADFAILVRGNGGNGTRVEVPELVSADGSAKWHRVRLRVQGKRCAVTVDQGSARRLDVTADTPAQGALGLISGIAGSFANLYVRELK